MQKALLVSFILLAFGCSSQQTSREATEPAGSTPHSNLSATELPDSPASTIPAIQGPDTISGVTSPPSDTVIVAPEFVTEQLEKARQHYMAALAAQEAKDSTLSEAEFEEAIQILNELSYYPDIESNRDFTELSQSIVEDYEKYIATIDDLGPEASVFALREKLSEFVEKSAVSPAHFPKEPIAGTQVPLPYNEHVEKNIMFFTGKGREHFVRWMHLSGRYFPMMKRIFREESVPEELIYVSMIESGLRNDARSWAKAVGIFQFMKGTGHLYGLKGNWWYDERRDFEKATRAAARHLKDLYAEFGDWYLSLGAYNAGAGRIYRAVRRSGSMDFWEMRRHLPRQTRNYIPQYIAVTRMAMNPEKYGFTNLTYAEPLEFDAHEINDCVDLKILAECAETDVKTLRALNPELLQWCTPPGAVGYRLRIPIGKKDVFAANYQNISEEQKRDWAVHQVKKGETLSSIAKRYGLETELIRQMNNLKPRKALSVGMSLTLPVPAGVIAEKGTIEYDREHKPVSFSRAKSGVTPEKIKAYAAQAKLRKPTGRERLTYRVKRGDTIGHIAEWYSVRASDLRNWNDIGYGSPIYPGQELEIWILPAKVTSLSRVNDMSFAEKQAIVKGGRNGDTDVVEKNGNGNRTNRKVSYIVRNGDTLEKIARQFGVSINELRSWNNLRTSRIYPGQRLEIENVENDGSWMGGSSTPGSQGPSDNGGGLSHRVRKGESLHSIAKLYGIDVSVIMAANKLRSSTIHPDQVVAIPSSTGSAGEFLHYRVKRGDTLWDISKKYGVTIKELKEHNDLAQGLRVGEQIVIPVR